MRIRIRIRPDRVSYIYADELQGLNGKLGPTVISEHTGWVEPTADNQWQVNMAPSGGPVLGPFHTRASAIAAEIAWVTEHVL